MCVYIYIYILAWTRAFNARSEVGLGNTAASKLAWTHFLAACLNLEIACRGFPGCLNIFGGSWGGCWALWEALQPPGLLLGLSCRSWGLLCLWGSPGRFWAAPGTLLATLPALGRFRITLPESHGTPITLLETHCTLDHSPGTTMAHLDSSGRAQRPDPRYIRRI